MLGDLQKGSMDIRGCTVGKSRVVLGKKAYKFVKNTLPLIL